MVASCFLPGLVIGFAAIFSPIAWAQGGAQSAPHAANVVAGKYECTANNRANAGLNFTIKGPGRYVASDGSAGAFTYEAGSRRIIFTGYVGDVLPRGTTAIYYTPKGIPTVSFRRDGEIAFCEKV